MPPSYLARVEELVKARMVYPPQALRRREQGIVRLLALIGADGGLLELTSETEATSSLTDAAMRAVRDAAPFPPLPPELRQTSARVTIPVVFSLK